MGCAFHPRCPAAFDMCGWAARDLRSLIEGHWLTRGEETYQDERQVVASLDDLDEPSHQARIRAGQGANSNDVEALLRRMRADDPQEPLWTGVQTQTTTDDGVVVDFYEGEDPALRPADDVHVACHLYPPPENI